MSAAGQAPPAGRFVLDQDAWLTLTELAELPMPASFSADRDPAQPRAEALERLRRKGILDPGGQVQPAVRRLLAGFSQAPLRLEVQTAGADRVVLAELAAGPDAVVGLSRLRRMTIQPEGGQQFEDAAGVELSFLPVERLLEAVWRLLPPLPGPVTPAPDAELEWENAVALARALRSRAGLSDVLADAVVTALLEDAGRSSVPPQLAGLAPRLHGAIRVGLHVRGIAAQPRWFGLWLLGRARLVGLRGGIARADDVDPGPTLVRTLRFVDSDPDGLRTDLTRALSEALGAVAGQPR